MTLWSKAFFLKNNQMCCFDKSESLLEYNLSKSLAKLADRLQTNTCIWLVVGVNLPPCKKMMFAVVLWIRFFFYMMTLCTLFYATFAISSQTDPSQQLTWQHKPVCGITVSLSFGVCLEEKDQVSEVPWGLYIPCPERYKNYCVHGECEYPSNLSPPTCR